MSQLTNYTYHGPSSGTTIDMPDGPREVLFHDGKTIELPADNEYVQSLVKLKHLKEVKAETAQSPKPKKPKKANESQPNTEEAANG